MAVTEVQPTEPQPAVAPPPGHPRFPHVDALRAIAALAVLVYHAGSATGVDATTAYGPYVARLNVGVALFFFISAFLLYRPFAAHRLLGAPGTRVRDYARRRLLRIVPAYWLALTLLAIWPGLPGVFSGRFWVFYGFLQVYDDNTVLQGIGPAWTLCVEMSFYVVLPLYAAAVAGMVGRCRRATQIRLELGLLLAIVAGSLAYRDWLSVNQPFSPVLNTLPVFADWFALGMAMALGSVWLQGRAAGSSAAGRGAAAERVLARRAWLPWLGALLCFLAAGRLFGGPHPLRLAGHLVLLFTPGEGLGIHLLFGAVGAGLLAPAVFGTDGGGWVRTLLRVPVLAWLGLISYGIYLYQQPLINKACQADGPGFTCVFHGIGALTHAPFVALAVIGFVCAVACAAASYYAVERPVLRFKYRRPTPR